MSGGVRVSTNIPGGLRKMIENIKEISGNHSDEEIYAMLKECQMDPNETAQKLLFQDTFHEVKRKRDRRKENLNNRETVDSRWRSGPGGRGSRGGRGNYSSRYAGHDAAGARNSARGRENGVNQLSEKADSVSSFLAAPEMENKETTPVASSVTVMANGPVGVVSGGTKEELSAPKPLNTGAIKSSHVTPGVGDPLDESRTLGASGASDPVLVTSNNPLISGAVNAIKDVNLSSNIPSENKFNAVSEAVSSAQGKMGGKSQGIGKNLLETSGLSTHGGSSSSRPSSNYGRQQAIGPQKVGPNKEWKPKPTNTNAVPGPKTPAAPGDSHVSADSAAHSHSGKEIPSPDEDTAKLSKELEGLHVRDAQHVIIPNHIHVPEAVRTGLSFGSFDASFVISSAHGGDVEDDKNEEPVSESRQGIEEKLEEPATSNESELAPADGDYIDPQATTHVYENSSSSNIDVSSSSAPEILDSKESAGGPQHPTQSAPSYSFGLVPPMLGNPLEPLESSETQAHDVSRVPNFTVQQPVDPTSFYAQFYRSGADGDGRISPFPIAGVPTKYSGNVAVLSQQSSQSPQEGGNSLALSTTPQPSLPIQAAGIIQTTMGANQQPPIPIFRQPAGVHIHQYPPNYVPYGHYFSPFYVPPPAIHQFLSNSAFPQQAQAGSIYTGPPAAGAAATAVKYPLPQYKPGNNMGSPMHMGLVGSYGPYGSSPSGFNPGSTATSGNTAASDDLAGSQFKDSNVYITGQQSEGPAVWVPAPPARDIPSLQANSFYNLPPQGQHGTFAPTQAVHGAFAGIYHPGQAVTAATVHPLLQPSQATMAGGPDMVGGPPGSVYQQPQHTQMNWPNNY